MVMDCEYVEKTEMPRRVRNVQLEVRDGARLLRQTQTPAEECLWRELRDRQLNGLKIRRQYAVGPYMLNFCCPAHKLAVELDGRGHDNAEQIAYDAMRTEHLTAYGYRVLRFRNDAVLHDLDNVLATILATTGGKIQSGTLD